MTRNCDTLEVFHEADRLIAQVYECALLLPDYEKYGLQSQLRRAAVSVGANLVEGCSRRTDADTAHFVFMATGSAAEVQYLLRLAHRLHEAARVPAVLELADQYRDLVKGLQGYGQYLERQRG
jgi:four helix bundle protein